MSVSPLTSTSNLFTLGLGPLLIFLFLLRERSVSLLAQDQRPSSLLTFKALPWVLVSLSLLFISFSLWVTFCLLIPYTFDLVKNIFVVHSPP